MDEQQGEQGRPPPSWTPPDAGADPDAAVGQPAAPPSPATPAETGGATSTWTWGPAPDEADGPPPPPWERQRRTRRRWAIGLTAAVVLAIPVGLGLASALSRSTTPTDDPAADQPAAGDRDTDGDAPDDGTAPDGGETAPLDAPDLGRLDGPDLVFAQLLLDIDASEQAMLGFQRELASLFTDLGAGDEAADLIRDIAAAGGDGADRLEQARETLERPVGDVRAEAVREVYLEHLDSWLRYLRAVEEDPTIIGRDDGDGTARYTLSINATADAFARELEDQLPEDVDPEVEQMVQQLLDRGFRPQGDANV